ncbi:MAG: nitroreductase [Campylobacterota bacterium]|nr:nitroreductase [Campylobacterota bacterium]
MNVSQALLQRKSVRAYLDKTVEKEKIELILEHAKHAPSGVNMQPWDLCVVSGESKRAIETKLLEAFNGSHDEPMDYEYYPLTWNEPYKTRRRNTGLLMYKTLDIRREDTEKQHKQWEQNYRAFDAPVVMYFFIDESLEKGSYIDYGMFLQSIMLMAEELGLATCTQAALAQYPSIVKEALDVPKNKKLLCGIALGYEEKNALVNSYRTSRIELDEFVKFFY